jgi:hypothetical protein
LVFIQEAEIELYSVKGVSGLSETAKLECAYGQRIREPKIMDAMVRWWMVDELKMKVIFESYVLPDPRSEIVEEPRPNN